MTRLAYILAASHSGSTLLSLLLGTHPQIATIGEMKLSARAMGDLSRYRCSCGEFIQECRFWQMVKAGMADRGFAFDLAHAGTDYRAAGSRYARRLLASMHRGRFLEGLRDIALGASCAWRRSLPEVHRRNAALVSTVARLTGADIVIDSSKNAVRLKYLLRNPQLEIKVIHLIRDGRAVALTYLDPVRFADAEDPARRRGGSGGDHAYGRLSLAQAARTWRQWITEEENLLQSLDRSQWLDVRYEDYCRDPDGTLSRLHRFLGVAPRKAPPEFRTIEQHVIGNGMRLDQTSEIRLDERWRSTLGEQDLETFNKVAGEMNRRYGYGQ